MPKPIATRRSPRRKLYGTGLNETLTALRYGEIAADDGRRRGKIRKSKEIFDLLQPRNSPALNL
jgi:hypothetical protein